MKRKTLVCAMIVSLVAALSGCNPKVATAPGKTPQPVLDNIAVQLAQLKDGARAARKIKEALLAEGKISRETSHKITEALIKVDRVGDEMNTKLATYESFTPAAKADLSKLFGDLDSAVHDLKAQGVFPAGSGSEKAVVILDAATEALRVYFKD